MGRRRRTIFDLLGIPALEAAAFEFYRPASPVPKRSRCSVCGRDVRVTARGTLWKHRRNPGLSEACKGSGPRAPRKPARRFFPNPDSSAYLLDILKQQDAERAKQAAQPQRPKRAIVRSRAKRTTAARKRRGPVNCQVNEPQTPSE